MTSHIASYKLNILVAYPYMKKGMIEALQRYESKINFLLDSGAFTAWNAGKPIRLQDYHSFLSQLPIKPWRYFALDVIGNSNETLRNYHDSLDAGYTPVPVFTPSQHIDDLERYYETTDLIGCGGLVTMPGQQGLQYIKKMMRYANGRNMHLLGFTKPAYIKHFRPYSCDSSSWDRAGRFGHCDLYVGNGEYIALNRMKAATRPSERVVRAIKSLGFDLNDFTKENNWRGQKNIARIASSRSWVKYAMDAERNIGSKIFLACVAPENIELLVEQLQYWQSAHAQITRLNT